MSLLDDEDVIASDNASLIFTKIQQIQGEVFKEMLNPLLKKIKTGSSELMPRICFEVNSKYTKKSIFTGGIEKIFEAQISIGDYLDSVLSCNNEKQLAEGVSRIDCRKVNRMGLAVDFVITALLHKSPIVLIENITELPDSPRRKDIENVLIHSWAKNKFVFLDNVYDNHSTIVLFTAHPRNEIKKGYYPVWDEHDHYQWYGNILKDYSDNGVIFIELEELFIE